MTIKGIAGKMLLYFYAVYRKNPAYATAVILDFDLHYGSDESARQPEFRGDITVVENLHKISSSNADLYAAMLYLMDSGFITTKEHKMIGGRSSLIGIGLASPGIDIIEGIERGSGEKREFNVIFNIKVENNMNVESLLKANVGGLIGVGLQL